MQPNTIYCGDSLKLLARWPAGCVDLAFADPPYNIGYVYDRYDDDKPDAEFEAWCRAWMSQVHRVLSARGSFYLAIGDDFAAQLRLIGRDVGFHLRNWIIWHYTFGQNMRQKFSRSHTHIFYFVKNTQDFVFNDHLLRFPSARHTEYQDLRASAAGRLPDDVWDEFPRVCGTFKEREGFHGCQLPEALLMRIILASSHPDEVVLDPFVGSGTTAVVAKKLGRRYVGIDLSPEYVKRSKERLAKVDVAALCAGDWPELHVEMLAQLYRETKVTFNNLIHNDVALTVIAGSLSARTGRAYSAGQVREQLAQMRASLRLPKLPNDAEFKPRNHVTTTGKRYKRETFRWAGRGSRRRRSVLAGQTDSGSVESAR